MSRNKATTDRTYSARAVGIDRLHHGGYSYHCPELSNNCHRPGALAAFAAPSRMGNTLRHPDGCVTDLNGNLANFVKS